MGRRLCWLFGTAAAFYIAVLYKSKAFLMLGAAGLLTLPFLAGTLFYYGRKLQFHLELPQCAKPQDNGYPLVLRIDHMHSSYISRIKVKMILKHQSTGVCHVLWLKGTKDKNAGVYLECKIKNLDFGMWKVSCPKIYLYDMFGWGRMRRCCKETGCFMILPVRHQIYIKAGIRIKWFLSDAEQYDPNVNGDDPAEIFKVREYQKGDRQNYIHWKLSARRDMLIVKEQSMPIGCNVVFFLDRNLAKMKRKQNQKFWEVVHTIAGELLVQECFYYLVWFDKKKLELKRWKVMSEEELYEFWGEISSYQPGSCEWDREYQEKFKGERYVADIRLDSELKSYCNGQLLEELGKKELSETLPELEIIL